MTDFQSAASPEGEIIADGADLSVRLATTAALRLISAVRMQMEVEKPPS
jgi:hypothetical protein